MGISCILCYASVGVVAIVVFVYLARWFFGGGRCYSKARLDGKVVIVSGANAGIGKETCVDLAKRGATIVMGCRNLNKGKAALDEIKERSSSQKVFLKELNLSSLKSIKEFAGLFLKEFDRLDVLVNNAGIMYAPYSKTEDGFESHFGVNHLGTFLLTNLLLKRLVESGSSRIVTVSSMGHNFVSAIPFDDINSEKSYNKYKAYSVSKLANVLFTKELHRKLSGTKVTCYSLHPGAVRTELFRHMGLFGSISLAVSQLFMKTPEEGAQTSIYCAVQENIESSSGLYFSDCRVKGSNKASLDEGLQKKLWEVSEEMTGIEFPL